MCLRFTCKFASAAVSYIFSKKAKIIAFYRRTMLVLNFSSFLLLVNKRLKKSYRCNESAEKNLRSLSIASFGPNLIIENHKNIPACLALLPHKVLMPGNYINQKPLVSVCYSRYLKKVYSPLIFHGPLKSLSRSNQTHSILFCC